MLSSVYKQFFSLPSRYWDLMFEFTWQTWRTDVTDRHDGQTWRTYLTDGRDGRTWQIDMMDRCHRQKWWTDMTDKHDGIHDTWWTDVMDRREGRTWWGDVTDKRNGRDNAHCYVCILFNEFTTSPRIQKLNASFLFSGLDIINTYINILQWVV